jgi:hypothetical protein
MPKELATQDAGLFFLARGLSEHGCSPTKIGEYWAMGLPGVIVNDHTDAEYRRAIGELRLLLQDPHLASRCRRAAETHYALAPACERQVRLYETIIRGFSGAAVITGSTEAVDRPLQG